METALWIVGHAQGLIEYFGSPPAVITAIVAAIWALLQSRSTGKYIEKQKAELQKDIEIHKSNLQKDLESFKSKLTMDADLQRLKIKKMEFIFEKEIDSCQELIQLRHDILPRFNDPGMDFSMACQELSADFGKIEKTIAVYINKYGAIIPNDALIMLRECQSIASESKFDHPTDDRSERAAEKFMDLLDKVEQRLIEHVRA